MSTSRLNEPENRWLFDVDRDNQLHQNDLTLSRVKSFLYESLHRSVTRHDLFECFQLLKILPKETSLDPYVLVRFVMILLESSSSKIVNKNVIIYLETLLSKLDICQPDTFVEFLTYFIKNNRIDDARELYSQRQRFMARRIHRVLPFVDTNLRCYEFYISYIEWIDRISANDVKTIFDVSIQGWVVNAINCLRLAKSNHEYFVMCLLKVLVYYGYYNKAYLIVSEFGRNNPCNIGAQLLHYSFINQLNYLPSHEDKGQGEGQVTTDRTLEEREQLRLRELNNINNFSISSEEGVFDESIYPIQQDKVRIMDNLRRLDCSRQELLELRVLHDNPIDVMKDLMDGMENVNETRNRSRWKKIKQVIEKIFETGDSSLITDARMLWMTRYRRFWRSVDFVALSGKTSTRDRHLIEQVVNTLNEKLDRPSRG